MIRACLHLAWMRILLRCAAWMLENWWTFGVRTMPLSKGHRTRSRAPSFSMTECKVVLLLFFMGEGWVAISMHPEEYLPWTNYIGIVYKSLYATMCLLSSYVCVDAALQRISANADSSTPLKCLASGIKSVEQPHPSTPWQTSALEMLVFCCFCILLVFPSALFYAMLI